MHMTVPTHDRAELVTQYVALKQIQFQRTRTHTGSRKAPTSSATVASIAMVKIVCALNLHLGLDDEVAAADVRRVGLGPRHPGRQEEGDLRGQARGHAPVRLVAGARQLPGER